MPESREALEAQIEAAKERMEKAEAAERADRETIDKYSKAKGIEKEAMHNEYSHAASRIMNAVHSRERAEAKRERDKAQERLDRIENLSNRY